MSNVIAFPRLRPLQDHEYPAYWGYMEKTYYEMRIEDGVGHADAFAEWDAHARCQQRIKDEYGSANAFVRHELDETLKEAGLPPRRREG